MIKAGMQSNQKYLTLFWMRFLNFVFGLEGGPKLHPSSILTSDWEKLVTKRCNYIHHAYTYTRMLSIYIKIFLLTSTFFDDVIKYRLHYRTKPWNQIFRKRLITPERKMVFYSSFLENERYNSNLLHTFITILLI